MKKVLMISVKNYKKKLNSETPKYTHQYALNGCGIACFSNLFNEDYEETKKDFESKFYKITRGIKVFDMVYYLQTRGLKYRNKFFNPKTINIKEAMKTASIINSITLIHKNEKYPVGHYLLRINKVWVDPWINLPTINNVHSGIREDLPGTPWYILIPEKDSN